MTRLLRTSCRAPRFDCIVLTLDFPFLISSASAANPLSIGFNRRRKRFPALVASAVATALLFTGCTSTKYKKVSPKEPVNLPVPINATLGTEPVATILHTVIVYKGPGSWKQEAFWDEYALTLRNDSSETVTIDSAMLHDYAGTAHPPGNNPWTLEKESKSLEKQYKDRGVAFIRYAGPVAALSAVMVGASYAAANAAFMGGSAAGAVTVAVAAEILIPVYLVTVISLNTSHQHAIEHEFHERRLLLPLAVKPGQERSGSLFFPMLPSPQALDLTWHTSDRQGTAQLPLPMLKGLHIDPAKKPEQAPAPSAP